MRCCEFRYTYIQVEQALNYNTHISPVSAINNLTHLLLSSLFMFIAMLCYAYIVTNKNKTYMVYCMKTIPYSRFPISRTCLSRYFADLEFISNPRHKYLYFRTNLHRFISNLSSRNSPNLDLMPGPLDA